MGTDPNDVSFQRFVSRVFHGFAAPHDLISDSASLFETAPVKSADRRTSVEKLHVALRIYNRLFKKVPFDIANCDTKKISGGRNHPLDGVLHLRHILRMKTAAVHSRIQPEIKEEAEGILQRLGLSPTEAIRMFYVQITLRNGLPFDVSIPNDKTVEALKDSRNGHKLERFDSTKELYASWDA